MDYLSCPYGETRTRRLNQNILNNNRIPPSSCLSVSPNNIAKTMRDNDTFNERKVFLILMEIGESRRQEIKSKQFSVSHYDNRNPPSYQIIMRQELGA